MRVYYMTSHEVAAEHILPERRMKVSLFADLNDPFELKPHALGDALMRRITKALERDYFGKKGILCFSDNWRSPVMWAHYADKHRGVCLGFDAGNIDGECVVRKVTYNSDRLQYELDREKDLFGIDRSFVMDMLHTKAHEWAYEREYRAVVDLETQDETTGHYYVEFGPLLRLREVILGARNEMPVGQMAKLVRDCDAPVQVFRARPAFQEVAMVRNKAIAAINVPARRS